jgi:starch-binding outer membrane protein, SusD/RagB family
MKNIGKIGCVLLVFLSTLSSCDSLLDVGSDKYVFEDEYDMTSVNDTIYSMFGVFAKLQKLADSYVLVGELRGDLMDVTSTSSTYLKQINDFETTEENSYTNNIKDYYAVINNCNYVINKIDTSVVSGGEHVMYKVFAAAKAIRAWTYMQIALNYKTASYYEEALLSVADAQKSYPEYTFEELAPILIADLEPWVDTDMPYFGYLYSQSTKNCFFPIRYLLGDLYLWTGQYEKAATEYRDLMYDKSYVVYGTTSNYKSYRLVQNSAFYDDPELNWNDVFDEYSAENITSIAASNDYGEVFTLDSLAWNHYITCSDVAESYWDSQAYYYSSALDTVGDLRKFGSIASAVSYTNSTLDYQMPSYNTTESLYLLKLILINDPTYTNKKVLPFRVAQLYLHYAEAVNRLGKPHVAMSVLKYGMNSTTLASRTRIPLSEYETPLPDYMDFTASKFASNVGIHSRGCGNTSSDTTYYVIPTFTAADSASNMDSTILYVEDLIIKELALETAFEGNRFQDLMRVAIRRDDNSYLADKVAAKHTDNAEDIKIKLMTRDNWYLSK